MRLCKIINLIMHGIYANKVILPMKFLVAYLNNLDYFRLEHIEQ